MKTLLSIILPCLLFTLTSSVAAQTKKHRQNRGSIPAQSPTNPPNGRGTTNQRPQAADSTQAAPSEDSPGLEAPATSISLVTKPGTEKTDGCPGRFPVETFLHVVSASEPQAAKNQGVYFLSDLKEVPQVFFLSSKEAWPEQLTFFPDGASYFKLSPDGTKLLAATQVGGDEQYDLYLIDLKKENRVTPLIVDRKKRIESVAWEPHSQWFLYTSTERNKTDLDLYRFDLKTMKSKLVSELAGDNIVTDISPDGNFAAVTTFRSTTESEILIWNAKTGLITNLVKQDERESAYLGKFSADSKGLFFLSDADRGIHQLYYTALKTPKAKHPLTTGPWEVDDFTLDAERNAIAYTKNQDGYGRIEGFLISTSGLKGAAISVPERAEQIPSGVFKAPSFQSPESFFYSRSASNAPSDIWLWKAPSAMQWTRSAEEQIASGCFHHEKLIRYPSFDGRKIPAFLYTPRGAQGPIPFVLFLHRGPEDQYRPSFDRLFQFLLQQGFGILAPNVRGSTGYGKEFTELDDYKKRMDSVYDAIEGTRWLVKNGYASTGKIVAYGEGYGGFLVLRAIEIEPRLFAAAAESSGITNFFTFLSGTKPYRRALRENEYGPLSDKDFLLSISPQTYLEKIKIPLLIFYGANDVRVPAVETEQFIAELTKHSIAVESKLYLDEGHTNRRLKNLTDQARLMTSFFERTLNKK